MKAKVAFVLGAGLGYVLGTRAGRETFDRMAERARAAWESPTVQEQVERTSRRVSEAVRDQGAWVAEKAVNAAKDTLGMNPPSAGPSPTVD